MDRADRNVLPARPALAGALLAGLLTSAAFPKLSIRPLAVTGTALLLACVYRQGARHGAACGLLYGLGFFVPLLSWLQIGAGTNAWLILAVLEAVILAASAAALALVSRLPLWPLWAAAVWVGQEAVRGRWPFGGFTWGRLGFSQDSGPLLRWAAIGGVPLVTFVVALAAALLVVAAHHLRGTRSLFSGARPARGAVALAALGLLVLGGYATPRAPRADRTVVVALVQGNVPRLGLASFDPVQQDMVIRNHLAATFELADAVDAGRLPKPAFVVWPENSTDRDPRTDDTVRLLVETAAKRVGVPVLIGAVLDGPDGTAENAGVVWSPDTGFGAKYVKRHLVPFGEYVPFRKQLQPVFGRLAMVAHDFAPGGRGGATPLDLAGTKVGDVICFEVAYDGLVRDGVRNGAGLLVVQTNNASFGRSALTRQQLAMSRVRAVEHGRAVLVAATSGISAVVAPDGSLVDASRINTRDLLVRAVPVVSRRTLATSAGAWPEWALTAIAGAAVLAALPRRVRR
jgi:apolipoprotein N-acyltransferase